MKAALFVALVAGIAAGWRLRVWYDLAQAKRAIRWTCREARMKALREAVARKERASLFRIEAHSPEAAIARLVGGAGVES